MHQRSQIFQNNDAGPLWSLSHGSSSGILFVEEQGLTPCIVLFPQFTDTVVAQRKLGVISYTVVL